MKLRTLSAKQIRSQLGSSDGLAFRAGRFSISVRSSIPSIAEGIQLLYAASELIPIPQVDFHVCLSRSSGIRKFIFPQVQFFLNGITPFSPLPYAQALPLLEWGLNWCITNHYHECLVMHAAVIEKNGQAVILPGSPGSGKSTLTAALVSKGGWRLLSDELTILSLNGQNILPNPRPVSLKNQSIPIVKAYAPERAFSPSIHDTIKGTVGHMVAPEESVAQFHQLASPAIILFPKYQQGVETELTRISRGETFIRLADNSFNYSILGADGFHAIAGLLNQVDCFDYQYNGDFSVASADLEKLITS